MRDSNPVLHLTRITLGAMLLQGAQPMFAGPPPLTYAGKLVDKAGNALSQPADITVRLYDTVQNGSPTWSETHSNVPLVNGIFQVTLGGSPTNALPEITVERPLWLSIAVNGDSEMLPRRPLPAQPAGVPSGTVVMWSGSIATIPAGWVLCDGSNGSPDLGNRFVVGASQDENNEAKTTLKGPAMKTGGEHQHTLTIEEMPSHTHGYESVAWQDRFDGGNWWSPVPGPSKTTEPSGGGQPHNITPPFYALAFIIKK